MVGSLVPTVATLSARPGQRVWTHGATFEHYALCVQKAIKVDVGWADHPVKVVCQGIAAASTTALTPDGLRPTG